MLISRKQHEAAKGRQLDNADHNQDGDKQETHSDFCGSYSRDNQYRVVFLKMDDERTTMTECGETRGGGLNSL